MSKESAHEFFAKTVHDGALQSRLATVAQGDWEGLRSLAQEAGFEVTVDDLRSTLRERAAAGSGPVDQFVTAEVDVPPIGRKR